MCSTQCMIPANLIDVGTSKAAEGSNLGGGGGEGDGGGGLGLGGGGEGEGGGGLGLHKCNGGAA